MRGIIRGIIIGLIRLLAFSEGVWVFGGELWVVGGCERIGGKGDGRGKVVFSMMNPNPCCPALFSPCVHCYGSPLGHMILPLSFLNVPLRKVVREQVCDVVLVRRRPPPEVRDAPQCSC